MAVESKSKRSCNRGLSEPSSAATVGRQCGIVHWT